MSCKLLLISSGLQTKQHRYCEDIEVNQIANIIKIDSYITIDDRRIS